MCCSVLLGRVVAPRVALVAVGRTSHAPQVGVDLEPGRLDGLDRLLQDERATALGIMPVPRHLVVGHAQNPDRRPRKPNASPRCGAPIRALAAGLRRDGRPPLFARPAGRRPGRAARRCGSGGGGAVSALLSPEPWIRRAPRVRTGAFRCRDRRRLGPLGGRGALAVCPEGASRLPGHGPGHARAVQRVRRPSRWSHVPTRRPVPRSREGPGRDARGLRWKG